MRLRVRAGAVTARLAKQEPMMSTVRASGGSTQFGRQADIRRRSDGTLDIDHYRQEALRLRAQSHRQLFARARQAWPLLAASLVVTAYVLVLPRLGGPSANRDDQALTARSHFAPSGLRQINDGRSPAARSIATSRTTIPVN
jgi:hypothetical protein